MNGSEFYELKLSLALGKGRGHTHSDAKEVAPVDAKLKHLEMLQGVINRMAGNSFLLKGWCVTLVSALLGLAASGSDKRFVLLAYYPALMFWILDGYYLRQERLFRKLYDKVRLSAETPIDFSMNTGPFDRDVGSWVAVMVSRTLAFFYITILGAILAVKLLTTG